MEQRQKSMAKSPLYFGKILERTGKRAGLILADQPFIYLSRIGIINLTAGNWLLEGEEACICDCVCEESCIMCV